MVDLKNSSSIYKVIVFPRLISWHLEKIIRKYKNISKNGLLQLSAHSLKGTVDDVQRIVDTLDSTTLNILISEGDNREFETKSHRPTLSDFLAGAIFDEAIRRLLDKRLLRLKTTQKEEKNSLGQVTSRSTTTSYQWTYLGHLVAEEAMYRYRTMVGDIRLPSGVLDLKPGECIEWSVDDENRPINVITEPKKSE